MDKTYPESLDILYDIDREIRRFKELIVEANTILSKQIGAPRIALNVDCRGKICHIDFKSWEFEVYWDAKILEPLIKSETDDTLFDPPKTQMYTPET